MEPTDKMESRLGTLKREKFLIDLSNNGPGQFRECAMRSIPDIRSILQESVGVRESDEITVY